MNRLAFLALLGLVIQNTALAILLKFSFRKTADSYAPTTVVLTTEILKLLVCGLVTSQRSFRDLVVAITTIGEQGTLFVPSLLYVIQNNLLFYGAQRLSSVVYIVCTQTKILTTAIISKVMLGTKLNAKQYLALIFLVFGVVIVQAPNASPTAARQGRTELIGVAAVLLASLTSGAAGVILEKLFKEHVTRSSKVEHTVWTRNVQLSLISLPFACFGVYSQSLDQVMVNGFFSGYDAVVWSIVLLQAFGGVIIGFVMKFASNILKCFAVALSICFCAVYSVATGDIHVSASLLLGLFLVNGSVITYSLSPSHVNIIPVNTSEHKK